MKTRKRILATLLSVAVAATTVLSGAVMTNAATIVTTTDGTAIETEDAWSESMELKNIGGEFYWHLVSSEQNNNINNDYAAATAPAIILDYERDMTFNGEASNVNVDIYPNGTTANMRFGIMIKYVDSTHWAYLNYDHKWMLEYKCDSLSGYPNISELSGISLADYKDTNIKISYESAGTITLLYTESGEESISVTIDNEVISALENYAKTAGVDEAGNPTGEAVPIHFGFKAGSYDDTSNSGVYQLTDVNLKNMTLNDENMMNDNWDWVVDREGQVFVPDDIIGGTNYVALNGESSTYSGLTGFINGDISGIFRPVTDNAKFALASGSVAVGYDGAWYYQVGNTKTPAGASPAVTKESDYAISMTIENGKLTATAAPATEGATPVTIANNVTVPATALGAIALKAEAGTEVWVRDVNFEKREYAEATELENKYNEVKAEADTNNPDNKYFTTAWDNFKTAVDNAKELLDKGIMTPTEADAKLSALNTSYEALAKNIVQESEAFKNLKGKLDEAKGYTQTTEEGTYSNATWSDFVAKREAAQAIVDGITKTQYQNESALRNTQAFTNLDKAMKALAFVANDQDKADLQAAVTAANALKADQYEEDSWNVFAAVLDDAAKVLADADATKEQIANALTDLNLAKEGLVVKVATTEEIAASTSAIEAIKNAVNNKLTTDAAYTNALKAVEDLLKKENVTKKELDDAIAVLEAAKNALKPIQQTTPTETLKNGQTQKVNGLTYKVVDAAKKTVALTKAQNKKTITIPATVKIGNTTCKVVTIAKGAFKGYKKLTSVTVGKNVTKIEANAFNNCKKLNKITFKGTAIKTIAKKAFTKITSKKVTVKVQKKLKNNTFKKKLTNAGLKKVTLK